MSYPPNLETRGPCCNLTVVMSTQPLPDPLQESIWNFVREEIRRYEGRIGAKVAEYEIHLSGAGQIEVEVLATESANDAAIDEGLEEAGSKPR